MATRRRTRPIRWTRTRALRAASEASTKGRRTWGRQGAARVARAAGPSCDGHMRARAGRQRSPPYLRAHAVHEVRAGDALREAREVFHLRLGGAGGGRDVSKVGSSPPPPARGPHHAYKIKSARLWRRQRG